MEGSRAVPLIFLEKWYSLDTYSKVKGSADQAHVTCGEVEESAGCAPEIYGNVERFARCSSVTYNNVEESADCAPDLW